MIPVLLSVLLAVAPASARTKKPAAPPPPPPVEAPVPPPDPLATMPTVGEARPFVPPTPEVGALSNQVPVWVLPSPKLPIFSLVLYVPRGSQLDAPGKEGTAALAMEVMGRGAGERDSAAFSAEVERRGLSISRDAGPDGAWVALSGPTEQLQAGLDLLADFVLRPQFAGIEVKKARELLLAGLQSNLDEPGYVASRTGLSLYWGPAHPYGRPADGTQAGLKKIGAVDLKKWHKAAWSATGATLAVAGAVTKEQVLPMLDARFGAWKAGKDVKVDVPAAPVHDREAIYIVDAPGSAQTGFYVAFPGLAQFAPPEVATKMGTIALGGTFTSRLNALLREEKGYTYGVRAAMESRRHGGTLLVRTRIRADVTAEAMVDLVGQLDKITAGIDEAELKKAQGAARQDVVEVLETQAGVAGAYVDYLALGRPPGALAAELTSYGAVRIDEVTSAMALYSRQHAVFVLVGDRALIEPKLREKGFVDLAVVTPP